MTRHPLPDWLLERYRLGEVTADERARVDAALAADASVKTRLEALERDAQATLAAHPPQRVAASIRAAAAAAASAPPASGRTLRFALAGALALGLAAVVVTPGLLGSDDDVRLKGAGDRLTLFALSSQGSEPLADGSKVRPGTRVQARYELERAGFAAVLSFDASGSVTLHQRGEVEAGRHAMPSSFELDASPGFERFVLVTAPRPLSDEALTAAAQRIAKAQAPTSAPLPLEGVTQRSVVLLKELP